MSSDRAQRRALARQQRKQGVQHAEEKGRPFSGEAPLWLTLLVALPLIAVPLYFIYLPPNTLIEGGYGQIIINEYQKYVAELVTLGLLLGAVAVYLLRGHLWPRLPRSLFVPVLIYLTGVCLSLTQAQDFTRAALIGLEVSLLPILFFLLISSLHWSLARAQLLILLMAGAGAIVGIVGICQGLEVWDFALKLPHGGAGSLVFFQNLAGEYLIVLLPPLLVLVFMPTHWLLRAAAGLFGAICLVHLVLTLARGAWVGLFGGFVMAVVFAGVGILRSRKARAGDVDAPLFSQGAKRLLTVCGSLLLVLVVAAGLWIGSGKGADSPYVQELMSINLNNTTGRLQIWTDSLQLLQEEWLLGVGPGHYKVEILNYLDKIPTVQYLFQWGEKTGRVMYPFRPHNDYLQNWIELGLLGIVGMLWLFAVIALTATRGIGEAVIKGERGRALLIFGTFCGFSAWVVSMLFEFPYRMPASMLLGWFNAAMTVALSLQNSVAWQPIKSLYSRCASLVCAFLVVACFTSAHYVFWGDLYGIQSTAAWNNKQTDVGYFWQQKSYDYAPWVVSSGGIKARMELGLGKYKEALQTSEEVLARNPNLLPALWNKGIAANMLGRQKDANAAFSKVLDLYPFLPESEKYKSYIRE